MRSLELVPTLQYLVQMDDDAVLCTQHLAYQLGRALNPRSPLKRFLFGFKRGTNYDNSFLLMSRDLAEFFQSHYYSELRGTHKYRGSIGASLGTGAGYRLPQIQAGAGGTAVLVCGWPRTRPHGRGK